MDLLSVVLWNQHIAVKYLRLLKVVKVKIQIFSTFPKLHSIALVGGHWRALGAGNCSAFFSLNYERS